MLRCMREHAGAQGAVYHHRCRPGRPGGAEQPARRMEAGPAGGWAVCVLLMPVLPFLEDNVENVRAVAEAAEAGARFVYPAFGMTPP